MSAAALPNASDVEQTAAEWLERRASEDWSEARDVELESWLAQSPAHAVAFMRLEAAWHRTTRLAALQQPMLRKPSQGTEQSSRRPGLKIAAAVMVTAAISVGAGSNLQDNVVLHADPGFPCTVGERVSVGHSAVVHGCTVEDDCLIGMSATILNGAVIGTGSLVAAGAVVLEGTVIPPRSLVPGVPAKVRRELTDDEFDGVKHNAAHYKELAAAHRQMHGG